MTSTRILAVVVGACVLAVSALLSLPMGEGPGEAAGVPMPGMQDGALERPAVTRVEQMDETHASLPRLWLGNPVAR